MLTMFMEMGLYALGVLVLVYLVYTLFFSRQATAPRKEDAKGGGAKHRRFERREGERGDRRKSDGEAPDGVERRQGSRRSRD